MEFNLDIYKSKSFGHLGFCKLKPVGHLGFCKLKPVGHLGFCKVKHLVGDHKKYGEVRWEVLLLFQWLTDNQHQSLQEGSQWETEREGQLEKTFYSRFFVSSCLQVLVWHLKICLSPFCPLFVVVCILSPICSCLCFVCLLWNTYKDCSKRKEWPWVGMVRQSCCKYLCYETEKHCISREREN